MGHFLAGVVVGAVAVVGIYRVHVVPKLRAAVLHAEVELTRLRRNARA